MTIEAEQDDIAAPGQTYAAHKLFRHLPDAQRRHFVLHKGGHFSLFHGAACQKEIVPAINRFLRSVRS
jgi:poly(3-hydroxybutyrate) depolymerase